MTRTPALALVASCLAVVLVGATQKPVPVKNASSPAPVTTIQPAEGELIPAMLPRPKTDPALRPAPSAAAPLYYVNWLSVNGGGATSLPGTNFRLGVSAGQTATGHVNGTTFDVGLGYWYAASCPIALSGDVNINGAIGPSDIIVLVNYVFKAGPEPLPCLANGDLNCNAAIAASDIIELVNIVFRAGSAPCNICTIIPSVWSCP